MTTEMQRLEHARPEVAPATAAARASAHARLRKLIEAEAPGASLPSGSGRSRRHFNTSALVFVGGSLAALVIALAALVLLHHGKALRGTATSPQRTAARGSITMRDGTVLATVQPRFTVRIETGSLPARASARRAEFQRLDRVIEGGRALGECRITATRTERLGQVACIVAAEQARGLSDIVVASDMTAGAVTPIRRERAAFPGVVLERVEVRRYPQGELGAQLLGTVGPITKAETREGRYRGVPSTAIIGQSGLEYEYDRYLRAGDALHLNLDTALQREGERSLAHAIKSNPPATGGAFVAMNPETGAIYAIGSAPTFHPSDFAHPMTQAYYSRTYGPQSNSPQFNRAIAEAGPAGSVFMPLTGLAAIQSGVWGVDRTYDDTGAYCFPNTTLCLHNAGNAAHGIVRLATAIEVADDTFFYNLGLRLNADPVTHPNGGALQRWARALGIGQTPGVDLPGAAAGGLPTPNYLAALFHEEQQCERATGPYRGHPLHPVKQGGCGIANEQTRYWTVGDNVSLAVGQNVLVSPLQVAVAYAAIANGGTIVTPHVGASITNAAGATLDTVDPGAARHLKLDPSALAAVRAGLRAVVAAPAGTADGVFGGFHERVYGKTGTAQHNGQQDTAWFVGYVPASATGKPILVVVNIDQGGFGGIAAAPVARQILSQWFFGKPGPFIAGSSATL